MRHTTTEKLIGYCGVDSGQIMIVDPCYVIGDDFKREHYERVCEITLSEERAGSYNQGTAVASSTAYGDGVYPVYATYKGDIVVSLRIDFDPQEDEDEEDEDA